jgi:hypothetical protein
MPHYYFDVRHGDHLTVDEEGFNLPNIAGVQYEATRSLGGNGPGCSARFRIRR